MSLNPRERAKSEEKLQEQTQENVNPEINVTEGAVDTNTAPASSYSIKGAYEGAFKFAKTNPGYALLAASTVLAGGYLGALVLNPTVIPYGLAALSGWYKTSAAIASSVVALSSAALIAPSTVEALKAAALNVSNSPALVLATTALLSAALIAAVYMNPAFLAFAGLSALSATAKAGIAVTTAVAVNAYPAYSLFKPTTVDASAPAVDAELDAEKNTEHKSPSSSL